MCNLVPLRTTDRVIRGISRFVGTPKCRIIYWFRPGTSNQKGYAMCILEPPTGISGVSIDS